METDYRAETLRQINLAAEMADQTSDQGWTRAQLREMRVALDRLENKAEDIRSWLTWSPPEEEAA